MDDLISRAAALDAIDNERKLLIEQERFGAEHVVVHHARRLIEDLSAVDAVPIVRCKDCKYSDVIYNTTLDTMPLKCLNIRYGGVMPDWYCEHGERRYDDE